MTIRIFQGDNLEIMSRFEDKSYNLIYSDVPFGTGIVQKLHENSYNDSFDDYLGFLVPRLKESFRLLKDDGSLFIHADYRWCHYIKIELDKIFGRKSFINEIIHSFDYGSRSKTKWSAKHNNIFWYAKNPKKYTFNFDQMDRIPYMAPGLVGSEKAARGKTPTSCWFLTIVHTTGKERTGYPSQKSLSLLNRIVKIHSNPGDNLLDFFAGSGSFGESAALHNRSCDLIDNNEQAINICRRRLDKYNEF